jgi:hypothetical protein
MKMYRGHAVKSPGIPKFSTLAVLSQWEEPSRLIKAKKLSRQRHRREK